MSKYRRGTEYAGLELSECGRVPIGSQTTRRSVREGSGTLSREGKCGEAALLTMKE